MSGLDSLPPRPLTDAELAALNRADAVDLAVDVTDRAGGSDDVAALLVATDAWVAGLVAPTVDPGSDDAGAGEEHASDDAADGTGDDAGDATDAAGGWRVVERVPTGDRERYDGLRRCEAAVRDVVDG